MSFEEDLAAQGTKTETSDCDVLLNGTIYTLRFLQLAGYQWAAEAAKSTPEPDAIMDRRYGYNIRTVALTVAKMSGRRVDQTSHGELLVELEPEQWDTMFRDLPGADVQRIVDVVWTLNEYLPEKELTAAKKAAAARTEPTSDSPSSSASPSDD